MAAGTFATLAGLPLPTRRDGADAAPDGRGKTKWTLHLVPLDAAAYAALLAVLPPPSDADSERALDGTLLTDRGLLTLTGAIVGGGSVGVEASIDRAGYVHHRDAETGAPTIRRDVTLVLREG